MAARSLQKLSSEACYIAGELKAFVPWAGPGAILAGWMVWPGLTPAFKEETFGLKPVVAAGYAPSAAGPSGDVFRSGGKYKYVRGDIGERPTLEED